MCNLLILKILGVIERLPTFWECAQPETGVPRNILRQQGVRLLIDIAAKTPQHYYTFNSTPFYNHCTVFI